MKSLAASALAHLRWKKIGKAARSKIMSEIAKRPRPSRRKQRQTPQEIDC